MTTLLLGIDIGTSGAKGALVRSDGSLVAQAFREHHASTPHPGWVEHDPEQVWWQGLRELTSELLAAVPAGESPAAVGISGIGPCALPADELGTPLRPALLYGVDTRATEQIARQRDRYGDEQLLRRCGAPLTSQSIGPKLEWLRDHEPGTYARTRRWFMAHSYLAYRLTGEYVLDHHAASQSTPLYDLGGQHWISSWCADIAPGVEFPELVWPADVIGTVTRQAASDTGLPVGIPVVAGTVDAWSEALAVGVRKPGDLMLMYGSTMFLVHVLRQPVTSPELWATAGVFPATFALAAGMATSGTVTGWLRGLTGADYGTLTAEAAALAPGAEGLVMLPYFAGERTPLFDPDARGLVLGLTLRHGRAHLYRAALEATAYGVLHNLEAMERAGAEVAPERIVAVGGGAHSLWTQIVSDVTGRAQQVPRYTLGAAYGNAFLAALGTDVATREDISWWNPFSTVVEPDADAGAGYQELYQIYRELYPATADAAHRLAARQRADSADTGPRGTER